MKQQLLHLTTLSLCSILIFASFKKNNDDNNRKVVGYLYTTTNGEGTNKVAKFARYPDGSFSDETAYTTNSKGGANVAAGGDTHGDFDAQGAVQIIGNYLLNVNAGGNTVSLFSLNRSTGDCHLKITLPPVLVLLLHC